VKVFRFKSVELEIAKMDLITWTFTNSRDYDQEKPVSRLHSHRRYLSNMRSSTSTPQIQQNHSPQTNAGHSSAGSNSKVSRMETLSSCSVSTTYVSHVHSFKKQQLTRRNRYTILHPSVPRHNSPRSLLHRRKLRLHNPRTRAPLENNAS
jgi:hypothetical protein